MNLTGAERYSFENLPKLEKHVESQASGKSGYSLEANLALLRFYQFNPASVQFDILAKLLLKALMQLPQPDFKICIHLVSEKIQADERIAPIISLAQALETTNFAEFWTQASNMRSTIDLVPGFNEAARAFMLHVITITYSRVSTKVLADSLHIEGKSLDALVKEKQQQEGWSLQSGPAGDIVVLPKNNYNQAVVKRGVETIKFQEVAPALDAITIS